MVEGDQAEIVVTLSRPAYKDLSEECCGEEQKEWNESSLLYVVLTAIALSRFDGTLDTESQLAAFWSGSYPYKVSLSKRLAVPHVV